MSIKTQSVLEKFDFVFPPRAHRSDTTGVEIVRRRGLIAIGLIAAVGFALTRMGVAQQSNPNDAYESLLNKVFPWPEQNSADRVIIAMRFAPSFHPESQIILRFDDKGAATAEHIEVRTGVYTLTQSLNPGRRKVGNPASMDRAALEKALGLQRITRRVEGSVAGTWLDEFWKSLARSPEQIKNEAGHIQLDGTVYELRVITALANWQLSMADNEVAEKANGRVPVVRWMNSVRIALDVPR